MCKFCEFRLALCDERGQVFAYTDKMDYTVAVCVGRELARAGNVHAIVPTTKRLDAWYAACDRKGQLLTKLVKVPIPTRLADGVSIATANNGQVQLLKIAPDWSPAAEAQYAEGASSGATQQDVEDYLRGYIEHGVAAWQASSGPLPLPNPEAPPLPVKPEAPSVPIAPEAPPAPTTFRQYCLRLLQTIAASLGLPKRLVSDA